MSWIDYLVFAGAGVMVVLGFCRGCSGELGRLAGLAAAVAAGVFGHAPLERAVAGAKILGGSELATRVVVFIVVLVACVSIWLLVGHFLKATLRVVVRQPYDAILGGVIGGAKALAAVMAFCALGLISPHAASGEKLEEHSVTAQKVMPLLKRLAQTDK